MALLGLLAGNGQVSGEALYRGDNLLAMNEAALNRIRGDRIGMVFQDPMTSLNPFLTIERQMTETLQLHRKMSRREARRRVIEALESVRIPDAARRIGMYPHEFSGGMRQRGMIAMALLSEPEILIADEPTTALDVTVQAQIIELLRELNRERGIAIILITHDMGVVAGLCDDVMVMYAGQTVEQASAATLFAAPTHPYTRGQLNALPRLTDDSDDERPLQTIPGNPPLPGEAGAGCAFAPRCTYCSDACCESRPVLVATANDPQARRACHRPAAEILEAQHESGCGKSTLARAIIGLAPVASGSVRWLGNETVLPAGRRDTSRLRRDVQMIFQDPLASLDPRMTIEQIVAEPLVARGRQLARADVQRRVLTMLERVGLNAQHMRRYPHEFSGGQCQRVGIARALIGEPQLVICDEPVSALDLSI
ncbi:MAG: Oligopeptide ABC transporter, ATP-binding protein OppD (TC 3.A.1.5.1) [uncultured Paraburkholderia sp.]|nr:MAG: Oligopeptide ABC transporter, ATP-binding protein OppD (TC 3.A.1.5.1) [uncultured Paraburkholderia sp.]CAH2934100.1 MAG: Oligopeptide ABC transporter, ATP-binding protein OppD (TC 3.A.1.5.1) [uncultured Paraburkholderia sp.]CAH2934830.1 MAG: Oligopeptide ABC transporter, ATP-binding protein OppD (TC 3.A.1.5.1) [uncultured Paraburkholderia sp.]